MADIPFVIAGKDNASPAISSVDKSLARMQKSVDKTTTLTQRLAKATSVLAAGYVAFKGISAALGGLNSINDAYDKQADSVRGLETALRLQGAEVESNSARLQGFAADMQKLTGMGDEATIALMRQASLLGVSEDRLEDVSKATIGLSEATGQSLTASMKAVQQAQEGNFSSLERLIPAIRSASTEEEKLAIVAKIAADGLEAKADASMTVSGMSERAAGAIGDLKEMIGAIIAPIRILISQGLKTAAEALQSVLTPAVRMAEAALANIGPLMDWVKEKVVQAVNGMISAFTFIEVVVTNLDSVWEMMVATVALKFEQAKGIIMHALTVEIPGYAAWFGENFVNLFRDAFELVVTIQANQIRKIIDAFAALWDYVASWGQTDVLGELGEIAGRSYLDGFESSLTALPEMATRKISEREQELSEKIGAIGAKLGDEFSAKLSGRLISLDDALGADFDKSIDLKIDSKIEDKVGAKLGGAAAGGGGGLGTLSASESRLLTRGPGTREDFFGRILVLVAGIAKDAKDSAASAAASESSLAQIRDNTDSTTQLVPVQ